MSKDTILHNVKIVELSRRPASRNGNPAFLVTLQLPNGDELKVRTQSDTSFAYEIENREWRESSSDATLTPSGRLRYLKKLT